MPEIIQVSHERIIWRSPATMQLERPHFPDKLDRALVSNLAASRSLAVLKAVVALCHAKEMTVVGEGVDTPEKLAMLTAAGCDRFQGYLISKPLPLNELAIWALSRVALAADKPADDDGWPVAASRR